MKFSDLCPLDVLKRLPQRFSKVQIAVLIAQDTLCSYVHKQEDTKTSFGVDFVCYRESQMITHFRPTLACFWSINLKCLKRTMCHALRMTWLHFNTCCAPFFTSHDSPLMSTMFIKELGEATFAYSFHLLNVSRKLVLTTPQTLSEILLPWFVLEASGCKCCAVEQEQYDERPIVSLEG